MRSAQHDVQTFDPDSALGRLESAGRNLDKAEKEGKLKDPSQAMGQVMGALAGAGAGTTIEAPSTSRPSSPSSRIALAGMPRQSISAERNAAMGMQVAVARARYGDDAPWRETGDYRHRRRRRLHGAGGLGQYREQLGGWRALRARQPPR